MKIEDSKRIYLLIFIAVAANGLTLLSKQFVSHNGQQLADWVIPIFVWPGLWILSMIVSMVNFMKINNFKSWSQRIMVCVIVFFCTPFPLIFIAEYF
ncbi:hypothetical protein GVN16_01490 [Emticicia sp. CRIBPO]|uniref:hypothetical protein n=1 Tax=Emticicia sp. CRIBPO TaxID=2683258 RepID=UPI001411D1B6|nr:hypothetical protein [Emticicia sp. CRIBPO]NBA84412.1 hypothetical protein [Emticicia sp. CRIBPO]